MRLNDADTRFVSQAIGRERVFKVLVVVGVLVGLGLLVWAIQRAQGGQPWGGTFALAILVLLNARSNLRQAKYARILRGLRDVGSLHPEGGEDGEVV